MPFGAGREGAADRRSVAALGARRSCPSRSGMIDALAADNDAVLGVRGWATALRVFGP
jgi:hypothetical protein